MSVHFTSHVHYTYGVATVDIDNKLLIGLFVQYRLKFLMNERVHTEYAMIINSSYLCYDMSEQEPIRLCCIVQKLSARKC